MTTRTPCRAAASPSTTPTRSARAAAASPLASTPRDRFLTVYGRRPVLEALTDDSLIVDKVLVADSARGREIDEIIRHAHARGLDARRAPEREVSRLSRNGRQDQGVAADVIAPGMRPLSEFVPGALALVLDGITNPANVGMILRTATAAGVDAVIVPSAGVADLGPLVIKASAGVAFRAPIVRARTAAEAVAALRDTHGYRIYGVDPRGERSLYDSRPFAARSAFVIGGEHEGYSVDVDESVSIPLASDVESLNAAVAAGVLCFELVRRRS